MMNTLEIVDDRMIVMNEDSEVIANVEVRSCRAAKRQIKAWAEQRIGIRVGEAMNLAERYFRDKKLALAPVAGHSKGETP